MRIVSRRARRYSIAVLGVAALATAALAPVAATASAEPQLVGTPVPYLIESRHAVGKVIEIGNDAAQPTLPGQTPAAAAVFPIARTAADVQRQAVLAYPVLGADDTFVLANADGEVLTRRANDDADFRYLTLTTAGLDAAAADPSAQWRITDAGAGQSAITNVQPYGDGASAGLDMYNWATATGAEVQTYDAGGATVQRWTVHTLTPEIAVHEQRVDSGAQPAFPASLSARYSWGLTADLRQIEWDAPAETVWQQDGTVEVDGVATGLFGEAVEVHARYLVGSLGGAADVAVTAAVGSSIKELQMLAPTHVERTVSGSETTVTSPVRWDWSNVAADAASVEGVIEVPAAASTGFDVRLVITVAAVAEVNVLRDGGVNWAATHLNGSNFALTDGVRDVAGFDDWRSGGAANRVNPNTVSFYFDRPRQLTGAAVYDIAGRQNVGGVTVQYRDLIGGWIDLPADGVTWPYVNAAPDLSLVVGGDPVLATGLRVVITHKTADNWMSLSEVEAFGPALAG